MTEFVRPAQGTPSPVIDAYLASELRVPMRSALAQAAASAAPVVVENIVVPDDSAASTTSRCADRDTTTSWCLVRSARDPLKLDDAVETRDVADRDILAAKNVQLRN